MADTERDPAERLDAIEHRLDAVERRLAGLEETGRVGPPAPAGGPPARAPGGPPERPPVVEPAAPGEALRRATGRLRVSAAVVLGWGGAAALVLAAAYLVRLSIAYGWLTPGRQVVLAALAGVGLVAAGLVLRARDRAYASLLAAAGVVALYLSVLAAHLVHDLLGPAPATLLAVAVAALSLGLHAVFRAAMFVAFALAGSYATPVLLPGRGDVAGLAAYLTVWNVVYAVYALWLGRRAVYLAAAYASIVVFDVAWRQGAAPGAWRLAAAFQLVQFLLFAGATVAFSIRRRRPLGATGALLHFGALLVFYVVQWNLLEDRAPDLAPWAAAGFAAALYGGWFLARAALGEAPGPGRVVAHAFGALVVVHAVYAHLIPNDAAPLAALGLFVALETAPRVRPVLRPGWWPWRIAGVLLFALGWVQLLVEFDGRQLVGDAPLVLLYPAALYVLYARLPRGPERRAPRALLLAVAHTQALAASWLLVARWLGTPGTTVERLWLSLAWGAVGVALLVAATLRRDRLLARSTLGVFAAFAAKVAFVDLDRADPLVRVGILVVLGTALYAGGWIYARVAAPAGSAPPADARSDR